MRRDAQRRILAAIGALLLAVACSPGCRSLSYPEPEPDATSGDGPQSHVATTPDQSAWVALSSAGRNAMRVRDYEAAEESYVAALAETGTFPIHDARVRTALGNVLRVARAHQANDDYANADRLIAHVVRSADTGRLADFQVASPIFNRQAAYHQRQGDTEAAIALYETALTLYGATDPARVLPRLNTESLLGNAYLALGRPDEAAPLLLSVLQGIQSRFGPESLQASRALIDVAALRAERGDLPGAERDFLRALAIQEQEIAGSLEHALNENRLAWLYLEHDRNLEAARHSAASVKLMDDLGVDGALLIASLDTLATAEMRQGHVADAEAHFARALALYDEVNEPTSTELIVLLDHYAEFARSTGDTSRSDALSARAARLRATSSGEPTTD